MREGWWRWSWSLARNAPFCIMGRRKWWAGRLRKAVFLGLFPSACNFSMFRNFFFVCNYIYFLCGSKICVFLSLSLVFVLFFSRTVPKLYVIFLCVCCFVSCVGILNSTFPAPTIHLGYVLSRSDVFRHTRRLPSWMAMLEATRRI